MLVGLLSPAGAHQVAISLKPYASTDLLTADVTVSGRSLPFIFDTGGGLTVLTPAAAKLAGCAPFGRVVGFRADGGKIETPRCGPVAVDIAGYHVRQEVTMFDLGPLLGKGAPPVGGLVGLSAFDGRAITLDLAHDRVIVETRRSLGRRIKPMRQINVRFARGAGGDLVAFLEVQARTGTLWLEVDSGNNGPVFLAPSAQRQLGISLPERGIKSYELEVVGLGRVPVQVASREMIFDGQLDPAFLRQMILTFDTQRGAAWAQFNPTAR